MTDPRANGQSQFHDLFTVLQTVFSATWDGSSLSVAGSGITWRHSSGDYLRVSMDDILPMSWGPRRNGKEDYRNLVEHCSLLPDCGQHMTRLALLLPCLSTTVGRAPLITGFSHTHTGESPFSSRTIPMYFLFSHGSVIL